MTEKEDQANIIGRNIDRLLYENRTTQAELAEAIGLSASAVGKWVLGHGAPRMGNVQKIANYFGVTVSDIVTDTSKSSKRTMSDKSFLLDRIESASAADLRKIRQIMELISDDEQTIGVFAISDRIAFAPTFAPNIYKYNLHRCKSLSLCNIEIKTIRSYFCYFAIDLMTERSYNIDSKGNGNSAQQDTKEIQNESYDDRHERS